EAAAKAAALIGKSPKFAEAYNQRAIALFFQDKFAESEAECQKVLELNPYHFGALGGLIQCQIQMGHKVEALKSCRRLLKVQPFNEQFRKVAAQLEAEEA